MTEREKTHLKIVEVVKLLNLSENPGYREPVTIVEEVDEAQYAHCYVIRRNHFPLQCICPPKKNVQTAVEPLQSVVAFSGEERPCFLRLVLEKTPDLDVSDPIPSNIFITSSESK